MGFSGIVGSRRKPLVFGIEDNKKEIIHIQKRIIDEYKHTVKFLNGVMMDVIRTYKDKPDRTEAETDLLGFAWDTNDCLIDKPKLIELLKKLKDLER